MSVDPDRQPDADAAAHLNETVRESRDAEEPARTSALVATAAAVLALGVLLAAGQVVLGSVGATLLVAGALDGRKRPLHVGAAVTLFAVVVAAAYGGGVVHVVPPALLTLVAWDAGRYGIRLGRQLGPDADTRRAELVHAASTTAVGAAGAAVTLAAYWTVDGAVPALAATCCLVGAAVLLTTYG